MKTGVVCVFCFGLLLFAAPYPANAADTDFDGIDDSIDNCVTDPNPLQYDTDKDGIGNVCDRPEFDADNDGVADSEDNCPDDPNPRQYDTDRDGLGNVCEPGSGQADSDSDHWGDTVDNCPDDPNPRQYDIDKDGIGVVCDPEIDSEDQNAIDRALWAESAAMAAIARTLWAESGATTGYQRTFEAEEQAFLGIIYDRNEPGPIANCTGCHATTVIGKRRLIVGENGDFNKSSHHVAGNPEDIDCLACHYTGDHKSGIVKLFDADQATAVIYEYDPANPQALEPFCLSCHDSDGARSMFGLTPFSDGVTVPNIKGMTGSMWSDSAHGSIGYGENSNNPITCLGDGQVTGCHGNAHGSDNYKILATDASTSMDQFCFSCHTDGKITNMPISGTSADDIEEAFGSSHTHNMGTPVIVNGKTFTLQCTSCHNPHMVSGKHQDADQNVSPVTRPDFTTDPAVNKYAMGSGVWGTANGEKIGDYASAGNGTYRTPNGDTFLDFQMPDYNTFCLDCHGQPNVGGDGHDNFGINWAGDMHGSRTANAPSGGGVCPNWYGCGKAEGWDGDDCVANDPADCWPVMTRGKGDQIHSRSPYNHEERVSGANFTLACTDCHEAHGSSESSMLRETVNSGQGTWVWNTMCNNCHYYYSDWHAGMSCGTASCHTANSIHRMGANGSTGTPRAPFDDELVLHYAFENTLKDSGDWQMDGKWYDNDGDNQDDNGYFDPKDAGSYQTGKYGKSIFLDGTKNVQVGTENTRWSTDQGYHGTHIFTDMKFNTTLEAWVYPTDDSNMEYSIFTKHVGFDNGGYAFTLRKVGSTLRAAYNAQVDNNGTDQGGMSGVRGAYSSTAIPLNTWTHVAATFDTNGPDRDTNNPSTGRIRIYVNGEDVTTSDTAGNFMQPGAGETSIFAYPENSPWNEDICYAGHWCTSEFSIGGFNMWQNAFIGGLDEAKVWNITKDGAYFGPIDGTIAPMIVSVTVDAPNQLLVSFSEGVFGSGGANELIASDFTLTCSGRSILSVNHSAGDSTAILALSSRLDPADIGVCTVAAANEAIVDDYNLDAGTTPVVISGSICPNPAVFQLNEASCSATAQDLDGYLTGLVSGDCSTFAGDGSFHGDGDGGNDNFIDFNNADSCMHSGTALTIEARIKPTGISTDTYVRRIFAKDQANTNYQVSVWRNNTAWTEYNAPDGTASIALWVPVVDAHGGDTWKVVKTDYNTCPIVSDHWYQFKMVWNSDKSGGIPGDIFVDDQGTDPYSSENETATENWVGYLNCTDSAQAQTPSTKYFQEGDQIIDGETDTRIGANVNNSANNQFNGMIDWISIQTTADYSGVDDTPNPPQP